jgi:DNA topoisomerase IB
VTRLRRSDCNRPGITRRRAGRGFVYLDEDGERIDDRDQIERIKGLVIPPAWSEVWICPDDNGHIQATGIDDAGRKQYLYHERWHESRAARKFETMLDFAGLLPRLRRAVARDLDPADAERKSVLACGVRLIDLGHFRVGGERYAAENDTFGVATIRREHVSLTGDPDRILFEFSGKGAIEHLVSIHDSKVVGLSRKLLRRRSGPDDFLVYRDGRSWIDVTADDVNSYIKENTDERFSAKDFRTWNGTVLAAVALAATDLSDSRRGRDRAIKSAVDQVADELGNTPAVARSSYVDPRLFDLYRSGQPIATSGRLSRRRSLRGLSSAERRVRELLG